MLRLKLRFCSCQWHSLLCYYILLGIPPFYNTPYFLKFFTPPPPPPPNFSAPYFFFFKQPSLQFPSIQSKLRQEPTEWGSLVRNHAVLTSSCFPQVLRGITTLAITNWCIAGNTLCSRCLRSELQIVHSTFCSTLRLLLLPYPNNTIKTAHTPGNL